MKTWLKSGDLLASTWASRKELLAWSKLIQLLVWGALLWAGGGFERPPAGISTPPLPDNEKTASITRCHNRIWKHCICVAGMQSTAFFAPRNSIYYIFVVNFAKISTYTPLEDQIVDQIHLRGQATSCGVVFTLWSSNFKWLIGFQARVSSLDWFVDSAFNFLPFPRAANMVIILLLIWSLLIGSLLRWWQPFYILQLHRPFIPISSKILYNTTS